MLKYLYILCFAFPLVLFAQEESILDRVVQCDFKNQSLDDVIDELSDIAEFDYSYRRGVLQVDKRITYLSTDKTVKQILDDIIADKTVSYELSGSQLIFVQTEIVVVRKTYNRLNGYVRDATTGEPIASAFIVDSTLRIAAETDQNGYYELIVPNPDYTLGLYCIADNYHFKNLDLRLNSDKELNLKLKQEEKWEYIEPVAFKKDPAFVEIENLKMVKMILPKDTITKQGFFKTIKLDAIDLHLEGTKIGLIPGLSTDLLKDAETINKLSINALIGYSAGTEGFEISGFMNVNRYNMKGVQLAGFCNNVGGSVDGVQAAGFYNYNGLDTRGTQLAGFANITKLGFEGAQIAGFVNANNGPVHGLQMAGFGNLNNGNMEGAQGSGFFNINNGEMAGFQASGFTNVNRGKIDGAQFTGYLNSSCGELIGFQGSGFMNYASGTMNGSQITGFLNYAKGQFQGNQVSGFANISKGSFEGVQVAGFGNFHNGNIKGTQVSGFINRAKKLERGIMFAPFNFCDSVERGTAIGFLSFIKHGLHTFELEQTSRNFTNLNFKTGTYRFYNILSYGKNFIDNYAQLGYGIGFATFLGDRQRSHFDIDLDWHNRIDNNRFLLDQTTRLKACISVKIYKSLEVFAGGALNFRYWRDNHAGLAANNTPLTPLEKEWYLTGLAGIRF